MIGITLTILLAYAALAEAQKETHIRPNRSTIVHLFEWKWKDIAKECESFLSPKGYGAVQVIFFYCVTPFSNKCIHRLHRQTKIK